MPENDTALVPMGGDIAVHRDPEVVLAEAQKAAAALTKVISAKPKKVIINGEQYLEFEDWQTVGRFYGVTPRIVRTAPVVVDDAQGWEATAEVVSVATGVVVATADAMCMNNEEKWGKRTKYEYHYLKRSGGLSIDDPGKDEIVWEAKGGKSFPKRERVKVGEEWTPTFQLRSMAQTRAAAKALRNALAWVVVLAGYKPTPAEEMEGVPNRESGEIIDVEPVVREDGVTTVVSVTEKTGTSAKGNAWTRYDVTFGDRRSGSTFDKALAEQAKKCIVAKTAVIPSFEQKGQNTNLTALKAAPVEGASEIPAGEKISDEVRKQFWPIARTHKWGDRDGEALLRRHGFEQTSDITKEKWPTILQELKQGPPKAEQAVMGK